MFPSLFKYFDEGGGDPHGGPLHWSSHLAAPFRGPRPPLLKGEEFDTGLTTVADFKFKEFDLFDPSQQAEYRDVMDRIVNGWYHLHTRELAKDADGRIRYAYVEWSQKYTVVAPNRNTAHGRPE